jgi:hypothetical protein
MPSTFTSSLRLVKQATGENTETWGDIFNQQFADLIDVAISGYASIAMSDADKTLTNLEGASDEARYMFLRFTGTLTANRRIFVPASSKLYFVVNDTSGDFSLVVKTASGSGVEVRNGAAVIVFCDGTNVRYGFTQVPSDLVVGGEDGETGSGGLDGTDGATVGYLEIPQNSQSADYTCVLADSGKHIYHPAGDTATRTWTIPANSSVAYPLGTAITFLVDLGAGNITLEIASDTLVLAPSGATGTRTLNAPASVTAVKVAATRWIISGSGIV